MFIYITYVLFGIATLGTCLYTGRLRNMHTPARWGCVGTAACLAAVVTLSTLHAYSNTDRLFLTWGGVLVAVYGFMFAVEVCICITHAPPETLPKTGSVLTVGTLAATVVESGTRRQYYAPHDDWIDTLRPGDVITFVPDPERASGKHRVGETTYVRQYCLPCSRMVQEGKK